LSPEAESSGVINRISELEVSVEGFSGPLDLLCCLVESREVEISLIRVSDIVRIYGAFLSDSGKAPISVIADFISAAAGLVLEKVLSLFPGYDSSREEEGGEEVSEEDLGFILERYLPYRNAARELLVLKAEREKLFSAEHDEEEDPLYVLGDLYSLSSLWWQLLEQKRSQTSVERSRKLTSQLEGMPSPVPDEKQVERRISELLVLLAEENEIGLRELMGDLSDVPRFVVTILALLELSRLGKVMLHQEELFGDVRIVYFESAE
jgi:segregation and condensation protein A